MLNANPMRNDAILDFRFKRRHQLGETFRTLEIVYRPTPKAQERVREALSLLLKESENEHSDSDAKGQHQT